MPLCDADGIVRRGIFHHGTDYPCTGSATLEGGTVVKCTSPAHRGTTTCGPHDFRQLTARRPQQCYHCYLPPVAHPTTGWTQARPLGDTGMRPPNYDGQGKTYEQELHGSRVVVAYAVLALLAAIIIGALLVAVL
jgi:hypothetical protein